MMVYRLQDEISPFLLELIMVGLIIALETLGLFTFMLL